MTAVTDNGDPDVNSPSIRFARDPSAGVIVYSPVTPDAARDRRRAGRAPILVRNNLASASRRLDAGPRMRKVGQDPPLEPSPGADVLTRLSALEPPDHFDTQHEADLRSWMGDTTGYRRVCRGILERFGTTADPTVARRTLFSCLLAGDAVPDRRQRAALLDQVRRNTPERDQALSRIAEGLYEYREGRFTAAVEILRPLSEARPSDIGTEALGRIIRAMAHARLGQVDDARRQFTSAEDVRKVASFDPGRTGPVPLNWNDWLRYDTLRRDAEGLFCETGPPGCPDCPCTPLITPVKASAGW
jgi:hypothetical protein